MAGNQVSGARPRFQQPRPGGHRFLSMSPYYSRVRFTTTVSATPFVYTVSAAQTVAAFGYQIGGDMAAGGRGGTNATRADTNLVQAQRTKNGDQVTITGISIQVLTTTQSGEVLAGIFPEISVNLQIGGGDTQVLLGTPSFMPGAGGLYGMGPNLTGVQAIPGGRPFYGFFSNGLPGIMNQGPVPEGMIWQPEGSDSNINLTLFTERAFATNLSGATASDKVNEAAASGIRGYTYPAAADVFVDLMVRLHGYVSGERSGVR